MIKVRIEINRKPKKKRRKITEAGFQKKNGKTDEPLDKLIRKEKGYKFPER